jgi:hypothetical protein
MASYVLWLADQLPELEKSLPALQLELTERARSEGGSHLRLPANIATLYIGFRIGVLYARHVGAMSDEAMTSMLELGWNVLMGAFRFSRCRLVVSRALRGRRARRARHRRIAVGTALAGPWARKHSGVLYFA